MHSIVESLIFLYIKYGEKSVQKTTYVLNNLKRLLQYLLRESCIIYQFKYFMTTTGKYILPPVPRGLFVTALQ
jgi:hypothetical protein